MPNANQIQFDPAVLIRLACPACHSDLRLEVDRILCTGCGRGYPIIDGIPKLIPDRAGLPPSLSRKI